MDFEREIRETRKKLEESGMKHGFTHEKTIYISKELDTIITRCIKKELRIEK